MKRRDFLSLAAIGSAAAAVPLTAAQPARAQVATSAHIVIVGAGAAGTALANRLTQRLDGARITIIDPRTTHLYQPGLTLVATGLKPANYVTSDASHWLPGGIEWIAEKVAAVDAETKTVSTEGGQTINYDWLVLAPGLVLDHGAIEGFSTDMIGENGIGALYGGPEHAARTWAAAQKFTEDGGAGICSPALATEMKCAGAPLKHALSWSTTSPAAPELRGNMNIAYAAPQTARSSACPSWPRRCACSSTSAASTRA